VTIGVCQPTGANNTVLVDAGTVTVEAGMVMVVV
jgi:hypothetical protein